MKQDRTIAISKARKSVSKAYEHFFCLYSFLVNRPHVTLPEGFRAWAGTKTSSELTAELKRRSSALSTARDHMNNILKNT